MFLVSSNQVSRIHGKFWYCKLMLITSYTIAFKSRAGKDCWWGQVRTDAGGRWELIEISFYTPELYKNVWCAASLMMYAGDNENTFPGLNTIMLNGLNLHSTSNVNFIFFLKGKHALRSKILKDTCDMTIQSVLITTFIGIWPLEKR